MTDGTTGSAPAHLDLDALADALAGERDETAVAHLGSCGSCASRLAELEAADGRVRAALGALPDPPLPAGLADRLSSAFGAEQPLAPARASVTALPDRAPRRRFLPAAAAAVLVLGAGGLGYGLVSGGSGSDTADTAASGGAEAGSDLVLNASGADYADEAAVAGVLGRVLQGQAGPIELYDARSLRAGADASAPSAAADGGSGSAGATTEQDSTTAQAPAAAMAPMDPLERLRTPAGLEDCLTSLRSAEEPDLQPRALDYAQYAGAPALEVLLPDPDPAKVSVYVLGPACTAQDEDLVTYFRVDAPR